MKKNTLINGLLRYLENSPTPFHATANSSRILSKNGFVRLYETDAWGRLAPGSYFVVRNDSSLIAFTLAEELKAIRELRMAGAHTDSPCLKIKPKPDQLLHSCLKIGVEVYGGALLNPWFDRDLSIAGRVTYLDDNSRLQCDLINFMRPIAIIPSLAIHLDRDANNKKEINKQTDLTPLLMHAGGSEPPVFSDLIVTQLLTEHPEVQRPSVLDFDLFFYDTQAPSRLGINNDLISSSRIDNLLSCYVLAQSISKSTNLQNSLIVLNDHEEVGSVSTTGAQGPFLLSVLNRLFPSSEQLQQVVNSSLFISVDNAHGVHPNFAVKHDPQHLPLLNNGPVIKLNANQRYASNSITSSLFRMLCKRAKVPVQDFVMRSDMACGSTIGPLTAAEIGVPTVDVGVPQLAMHSIRETAGTKDCWYLYRVMHNFFGSQAELIQSPGIRS